jgi:hypothetical protein
MRKITMLLLVLLFTYSIKVKAQTLQTVTNNGNTTDQTIYVNSIHVNDWSSLLRVGRLNDAGARNTYIFGYANSSKNAENSIVAGHRNDIADASSAVIYGRYNNAGGHLPIIFGYRNNISTSSDKCYAIGRENYLDGKSSYALGVKNTSTNTHAGCIGYSNEVSGEFSIGIGDHNYIYTNHSYSLGAFNNINSNYSAVLGYGNNASAIFSYVLGYGITNDVANSVMIGTSNYSKLTILNNGNVLLGKTSQQNSNYKLDVEGFVRARKVVVNTTGADFVFDYSKVCFTKRVFIIS